MLSLSTVDVIPNNTLVRFTGMVQDMFNPEYYVSEYQDRGSGAWVTTRWGDGFVEGSLGCEVEKRFDERIPVLIVPVPGMSGWVVDGMEAAAKASVAQFGGGRGGGQVSKGKRGLDVEMARVEEEEEEEKEKEEEEEESGGAKDADAITSTDAVVAKKSVTFGDVHMEGDGDGKTTIGANNNQDALDIPRGSCVVHLYGNTATMKLNEVVEVFGVISRVPELASGTMHGLTMEEEGAAASMVPTSVAPRVHAILQRKVGATGMAGVIDEDGPAGTGTGRAPVLEPATRERIVGFLKQCLRGDALAAEYVLMHLVSRAAQRSQGGGATAGQETQLPTPSLNITGVDDSFSAALWEALSQLVPSVVHLPLEIEALNRKPWYPVKVNERVNGSAVLQLPAGAVLVLDETAMRTGELTETGLKNLGAIQTMMQSQKLPYDFQFYQLEQPTDQPIFIASAGRTMLKGAGEIQVPLTEEKAPISSSSPVSPVSPVAFEGDIEAARRYLAEARSMAFSIPKELVKHLEHDMIEASKDRDVNAETFHRWMNLSRLLCCSHGEGELSLDRWRQMLSMEAERLGRISR